MTPLKRAKNGRKLCIFSFVQLGKKCNMHQLKIGERTEIQYHKNYMLQLEVKSSMFNISHLNGICYKQNKKYATEGNEQHRTLLTN